MLEKGNTIYSLTCVYYIKQKTSMSLDILQASLWELTTRRAYIYHEECIRSNISISLYILVTFYPLVIYVCVCGSLSLYDNSMFVRVCVLHVTKVIFIRISKFSCTNRIFCSGLYLQIQLLLGFMSYPVDCSIVV